MRSSIVCLLGAGFSYVAGVPLGRHLFKANWLITMSERSRERFLMVREHYESWQKDNPGEYPEQYMGLVYSQNAGPNAPKWDWVVEYSLRCNCISGNATTIIKSEPPIF